jgi:hypothetical protein
MLEFEADDGPEVDAVEGYLLAVPRALAARSGSTPRTATTATPTSTTPSPSAPSGIGPPGSRCPRPAPAPGYHDTDPAERDRASRKNYDRFLGRWKGRTDLLTREFRGYHRHR